MTAYGTNDTQVGVAACPKRLVYDTWNRIVRCECDACGRRVSSADTSCVCGFVLLGFVRTRERLGKQERFARSLNVETRFSNLPRSP